MVDLTMVIFGLWCIIIFTSEKVIVMENPLETKPVILRKEKQILDNNKSVRAILTNYLSCILVFSLINCANCYFASLLHDKIHLLVSSKLLYPSRLSNDKIFVLDKQHKMYTPSQTFYYIADLESAEVVMAFIEFIVHVLN